LAFWKEVAPVSVVELKWIPVRTAAHRLGVSRQRVHKLIKFGIIEAVSIDGTVLVSARAVEARIVALGRLAGKVR
jgi:hypothetical protein